MYFCEEYMYRTKTGFSVVNTIKYLVICVEPFAVVYISCMYKGVRLCPTKTYYTLTNGKINSNQLYLSLHQIRQYFPHQKFAT